MPLGQVEQCRVTPRVFHVIQGHGWNATSTWGREPSSFHGVSAAWQPRWQPPGSRGERRGVVPLRSLLESDCCAIGPVSADVAAIALARLNGPCKLSVETLWSRTSCSVSQAHSCVKSLAEPCSNRSVHMQKRRLIAAECAETMLSSSVLLPC
jgi:hypothetical protein